MHGGESQAEASYSFGVLGSSHQSVDAGGKKSSDEKGLNVVETACCREQCGRFLQLHELGREVPELSCGCRAIVRFGQLHKTNPD